ncbi:hypothetical protein DSO57_1023531 [Entomophthora muscae]|uniref:Uncharacterized protein n=1 Tax=Entomophthora muscae TaxID=34485 RepID=A0ACC2UNM6_9FUNG|nr:hypothetical protein DSO57_1023531 [Entomophthora muscae]
MKGILFLLWFLVFLSTTVEGLEDPTPTINWQNSLQNEAHQKESLANGWFKYPSGHWGRKFHYGRHSTPPQDEPLLVQPHTSFYLLTYLVRYYLLGCFSSLMGRFAYLGHMGHLAMVTVPIGSAIAGLNLRALIHQIGGFFLVRWIPDMEIPSKVPPCSDPWAIEANDDQTKRENKCLQKTFIPIQDRHEVGDKVWVMNVEKSKLEPKKVGPPIILKVKKITLTLCKDSGNVNKIKSSTMIA